MCLGFSIESKFGMYAGYGKRLQGLVVSNHILRDGHIICQNHTASNGIQLSCDRQETSTYACVT